MSVIHLKISVSLEVQFENVNAKLFILMIAITYWTLIFGACSIAGKPLREVE